MRHKSIRGDIHQVHTGAKTGNGRRCPHGIGQETSVRTISSPVWEIADNGKVFSGQLPEIPDIVKVFRQPAEHEDRAS